MAIFDRNYDRDYGYRGGSTYRGSDRGLGDRMENGVRRGWNRLTNGARETFDGDDDRGYGYRGGAYGSHRDIDRPFGASGYDREMGSRGAGGYGYGAGGGNWQRESLNRLEGDNRDLDRDGGWYAGRGMGMGGAWNYDRDYDRGASMGASDMDSGYDRDYKGRWQTDNGDPFGDRVSRTPIRMMRGGFRNDEDRGGMGSGYDRDFGRGYGADTGRGYDRDMTGRGGMDRGYMHGIGYDPYDADRGRAGGWRTQNRGRGYDRGWF